MFDLISSGDREKLRRASEAAKSGGGGGRGEGGEEGGGKRSDGGRIAMERGSRWDRRPGSSVAAAITSGSESAGV